MDKISKALERLRPKEREQVKKLLMQIEKGDVVELDLKKLKHKKDIFRVRKGDIRILFERKEEGISILAIERRSENTYK